MNIKHWEYGEDGTVQLVYEDDSVVDLRAGDDLSDFPEDVQEMLLMVFGSRAGTTTVSLEAPGPAGPTKEDLEWMAAARLQIVDNIADSDPIAPT